MSRPYRLVIFDWEGTLSDTLGPVLNLIANEARRMHFGALDINTARQSIVFGLPLALKKLFPNLSLHQHEQLLQSVQQALAMHASDVCLIPGAFDVIKRINQAGISLAVATNKGQQSLMRALQVTDLNEFFPVTRCAGQTPAKPCPQMLEEIMDAYGMLPFETLMVGDSVVDIEMAAFAKVDAVGVSFDHMLTNELREAGAKEVFDEYRQLADFLQLPSVKD